jgi:transposase-like protein
METKGISQRQHRASKAERLEMVEQFRRSGLTRPAFCQQYGVPKATLSWWLRKTKQTSNLPVPVLFSEVRLEPKATAEHAWAMEVVAPSGLTIRCREALSVRSLAHLVRGSRC